MKEIREINYPKDYLHHLFCFYVYEFKDTIIIRLSCPIYFIGVKISVIFTCRLSYLQQIFAFLFLVCFLNFSYWICGDNAP